MTDINPDVLERVRALPPKQQKRFTELIESVKDNPRETAAKLRQDILDGAVETDFQLTAQLAVAALADSHAPDRFPTDEQVIDGYKIQIRKFREAGNETAADHLQGIVDTVMKKESETLDRMEAVCTAQQKHLAEQKAEAEAAFKKAYDKQRQHRIDQLTAWGRMTVEQAEKQFQQLEHNNLIRTLRSAHGLQQQSDIQAAGTG